MKNLFFDKLTRRIKHLTKIKSVKDAWAEGFSEEVIFWKELIRQWQDSTVRLNLRQPIPAGLHPYFLGKRHVKILSVGCGPCSDIGYQSPDGFEVELHLTDALAKEYEREIWAHKEFKPPVEPRRIDGEELSHFYDENSFDLVYSVNALDHSYNPASVINEMVKIVKPGCYVVIEVWENEAVFARGTGLHQWCVYENAGDLILEHYHRFMKINISRQLKNICDFRVKGHYDAFLNGDHNHPKKKRLRIEMLKKTKISAD